MPSTRYDAVCSGSQPEHDCSVCLTRFEPESEINRLSCGHLFHKWKEPEEMFGLSGLKNHLFSTLSLAFHLQSFQSWTSFKGKSGF
ncbi:hypothetical protein GOBAR_DD13090 [Gossypium barbadense]|nr:hypothetical protein GOBAR_DD13090 [Gossypium barbadense]